MPPPPKSARERTPADLSAFSLNPGLLLLRGRRGLSVARRCRLVTQALPPSSVDGASGRRRPATVPRWLLFGREP